MRSSWKNLARCCFSNWNHRGVVECGCCLGNSLIEASSSTSLSDISQFLTIGGAVTGTYMIVIESVYQVMPLVEIEVKRKDFCDYIGFLLTFGYLASMDVSLFLTTERYLATVFCLKPDLRMKMKHVLLAPLLATTASLALSIWAQLFKAWAGLFKAGLS